MDPTYKGLPTPVPTRLPAKGPNLKLALIVGGGFLLLVVILGLLFAQGDKTDALQRLGYRIDTFTAMVAAADPDIKDDELAKLNAELALVIGGDAAALDKILPSDKGNQTLATIKAQETDALNTTKAELKTALSGGGHDTTYRKTLQEKIQALYSLATEAEAASRSAATKASLETLREHLEFYFNQLKKS